MAVSTEPLDRRFQAVRAVRTGIQDSETDIVLSITRLAVSPADKTWQAEVRPESVIHGAHKAKPGTVRSSAGAVSRRIPALAHLNHRDTDAALDEIDTEG